MGFFIFWVVFLLVVLLAVPVASFLEKRKNPPPYRPDSEELEGADEAGDEVVAEAEGEAVFEAADEMPAAGDGFAEFEEIR